MDDRVPPHSLDAERAVLGGMMLENSVIDIVLDILKPGDFYSDSNEQIFSAIIELHRANTPVDTVTLRDRLAMAHRLAAVGGDEYLLGLTDTIPAVENIRAHANLIREKAAVRRLITTSLSVAAKGFADYGTAHEYLTHAEKAVFDASSLESRSSPESARSIAIRTFEHLHALAHAGERVSGLRSGFTRLDHLTAGMHPGDLIIIAGRPGMGKTSFALNIAVNAAHSRQGTAKKAAVAVFSLEMPKEQLFARMLASEARVDAQRLRTGLLDREDWTRLAQAAGTLSELPLFIDDTPALNLMELRAKARRLHVEHGLALIVIDYLQLMRSGMRTEIREQEISEISRTLKALAKEMQLPIIALSQLNRSVESRGNKDKRPQLSDLRESGAIEQDADTIHFIYRDELYNRESEEQGIAEIIIGKQRSGPTGTVKVRFFREHTRFDNLAEAQGGPDE